MDTLDTQKTGPPYLAAEVKRLRARVAELEGRSDEQSEFRAAALAEEAIRSGVHREVVVALLMYKDGELAKELCGDLDWIQEALAALNPLPRLKAPYE